jgi:two-component system response regulator RegA
MREEMGTFLVVDDDEPFRERLLKALRSRGFEVYGAADHDAALASARAHPPRYAVIDLRMPGRSGLEVVRALKALAPEAKLVVLTGYGSIATAVEAIRLGADHYLSKPADADDLLAALARTEAQPPPEDIGDRAPSLARAEWEHINRVLADCGGNISQAARRLGIHRRSLQRKLQKYPPKK